MIDIILTTITFILGITFFTVLAFFGAGFAIGMNMF